MSELVTLADEASFDCWCGAKNVTVDYTVLDEHRWTREAIADWLEPIEEAFYAERERKAKACEPESAVAG